MTPRRRHQPQTRGFALLVIVLLVALIAVTAVALLDMVQVDLRVVGQQRRSTEAEALAVGAMVEVVSDDSLPLQLPSLPDPANLPLLSYQYAGNTGVGYQRDPMNRFATSAMTPVNSAYVRDVGTTIEAGYEAFADLLRISNPQDTGLTKSQVLTYELTVRGSVNAADSTREVRAQVQRVVATQNGTLLTAVHAR